MRLAAAGAAVSDTGHGESLAQRCLTCTTEAETVYLFHYSVDTHSYEYTSILTIAIFKLLVIFLTTIFL